jgi:hypothetical protein
MSYDDTMQQAASRLVKRAVEGVDTPNRLAQLHRARRRERLLLLAGAPVVAILLIGLPILFLRGGEPSFSDQPTTSVAAPTTTTPVPTTIAPVTSTEPPASSTTPTAGAPAAVVCPGPAPLPDWAKGSEHLEGVHGSVAVLVDAMNRLPGVVWTQTDFSGEWIEKPPSDAVVSEVFARLGAVGDHAAALVGDPEYVRLWPRRAVWLSDLFTAIDSNQPRDFLGELTDVHSRDEALAHLSEEGHDPSRCEVVATIVSRTDAVFAGALENGGPPSEMDPQADLPRFVLTSSWTPNVSGALVDLAFSDGWLWAAYDLGGVVRIDPSTGDVETAISIAMPHDAVIEIGEGAVWVAHGNWLTRIDPESAEVVGTADVGPWGEYLHRPMAVGEGAVWLATESGIARYEPAEFALTHEMEIGTPSGIVLGADALWALVGQQVIRIDPVSLEIEARVTVPGQIFYPSIGTPLAYGNGAVWIGAGGLARLDPATNQIETVYAVADEECCGPIAIGFAEGNVIVSGFGEKQLAVVDPETGTLEGFAVTRCSVFSIAESGDGFWAAVNRCGPAIQRYNANPG